MRRFSILLVSALLLTVPFASRAQDDSGFSSTVNWFYSACEDRMVIDLHGQMQLGYDLYFQAFERFGGLGEPITALRRISVNGEYSVSQVIYWLNGETRGLRSPISVVIRIGRENDPESTIFQQPSDDVLGDCEEPGSTLVEGTDVTGPPEIAGHSGVFLPDGGFLNPVYADPDPGPLVLIGAREQPVLEPGRTDDPGIIFAECMDVEGADPGILYDTDQIRVFWSWYAKTAAQVRDHINSAQYGITLSGRTLPNVQVSEVKQLPGSIDWWVFYTVNLGDKWEPGHYHINFALTWSAAISDGYDEFGPGTENELLDSGCSFSIQRNPWGVEVLHEQPSIPLKSYP